LFLQRKGPKMKDQAERRSSAEIVERVGQKPKIHHVEACKRDIVKGGGPKIHGAPRDSTDNYENQTNAMQVK
jgi:hypothetical protein